MTTEPNNLERAIGKLEGKMDMLISSMEGMAQSFANLEKGRLSTLEINFAKMQVELADRSKTTALKTSALVSIVVGVIVSVLSAFIIYNFKN